MNLFIHGYKLVLTCTACPEQYDVFDPEGNQVGYLRLRHGRFSVRYPGASGVEVFAASPDGDGVFDSGERLHYLKKAIKAIQTHCANDPFDSAENHDMFFTDMFFNCERPGDIDEEPKSGA